jgi:tight adherence protein C
MRVPFSDLAERLERAGLPKTEETAFRRRCFSLGAGCGVAGLLLVAAGLPFHLPATLGILGFLWPGMKLNAAVRKRQRAIDLNLPYYLDLSTLALEAGLDLIAATEEILRNDRPNPLREELEITLHSIRMGSTRREAFARLAGRTGLASLAHLASSVAQSEEMGTGLGGLFRLQAESLRRELYRQAEEAAQRAPMKLLIPLIGLIFPVVFLLLFAPLFLRFFL